MFYLLKFYYWEPGYMNSLDIILDYAGQYVMLSHSYWQD